MERDRSNSCIRCKKMYGVLGRLVILIAVQSAASCQTFDQKHGGPIDLQRTILDAGDTRTVKDNAYRRLSVSPHEESPQRWLDGALDTRLPIHDRGLCASALLTRFVSPGDKFWPAVTSLHLKQLFIIGSLRDETNFEQPPFEDLITNDWGKIGIYSLTFRPPPSEVESELIFIDFAIDRELSVEDMEGMKDNSGHGDSNIQFLRIMTNAGFQNDHTTNSSPKSLF